MAVTHVFVRALPGKTVPLSVDGRVQLLTAPGVYRVPYTTETRKRITALDLELCDRNGGAVKELAGASAPDPVPLDESGAVAPIAPTKAFDTSDTKD